ncbi:MAG: Stk1 family PASTA domain-containing Ser/Thr kinase [bacterium]
MTTDPGTVIAQRYEILEPIGQGGMAHVYRARRRPDGQIVALKVLYEHYAGAPEFVTRFQREARSAASLTHPHVVRILDSGRDNGTWFIAMEHVEGETLKQLVAREGALPVERACQIAGQVCEALEYAHSRGIVHRDIKPQNILVSSGGAVKVADFGIARAVAASTITQPGSVVGSAQYLSPEQARGDAAGEASDLYALGIVLYEMVTGRLPFDGETPVALALKHIQETPPPPRTLDERISPRVERIILCAMAKQPEMRYSSAAEMRGDLMGHSDHWRDAPTMVLPPEERTAVLPPGSAPAASAGTPAATEPPPPPLQPTPRRRPMSAVTVGTIAVFVLLLAGWAALGMPGWRSGTGASSTDPVIVPDLRGMVLARAETLAEERGLQVVLKRSAFHETVPKDVVVNQDPAPGTQAARRSIISLVLSLGSSAARQQAEETAENTENAAESQDQEAVEVPDLRGLTVEEASSILSQSRLQLGTIEHTALSGMSPGQVVSQWPEAQARVRRGTAVNLLVRQE